MRRNSEPTNIWHFKGLFAYSKKNLKMKPSVKMHLFRSNHIYGAYSLQAHKIVMNYQNKFPEDPFMLLLLKYLQNMFFYLRFSLFFVFYQNSKFSGCLFEGSGGWTCCDSTHVCLRILWHYTMYPSFIPENGLVPHCNQNQCKSNTHHV